MKSSTYQTLEHFILHKMSMQHVYQPVMLSALLESGGTCDVDQIAAAILRYDQSQIEYYEKVTKNMVGRVLANHGIVTREKTGNRVKGYRLSGFEGLTASQVRGLLDLCQEKLDEYLRKHGAQVWAHRQKASGYISGTIRYEVLKRAKLRCELCGISAKEKALQVDHIVPRAKDGTDDLSNLQALCYSCNAMKQDRDDTDFRGIVESYAHRESGCLFCEVDERKIIAENELCYAIRDGYPVTDLHTLVIPKRHVSNYFDLHQPELNAVHALLAQMKDEIQVNDSTVSAFNIGINAGREAGQTIFHAHIHLIPRRKGDVDEPRGGVRGVIAEKQQY
jgi:ATP adenylyltransferase